MISRVEAVFYLAAWLDNSSSRHMSITPDNLQRVLDRSQRDDRLAGEIREALGVIDGVLDDYGSVAGWYVGRVYLYDICSEEHVAMSFNGGKDCESFFIFLPWR